MATQGEIVYGMSIEGTDQALNQAGTSILKWGKSIATALGLMFGAALFKEGFDELLSLDESLRQIQIISKMSTEEVDDLKDHVEDLANVYGTDAAEGANAFYQIVSAGFSGDEAYQLLDYASALAAVGAAAGETVTAVEAADILTTIMNAFGYGISDLDTIAEELFLTIEVAKTSIGDMAGSLSQVSPIASAVGLEIEDLLVTIAALTKQGASSDEAMTELKNVLNQLLTPADEIQDVFEELGVTDVNELFASFDGLIPSLQAVDGAMTSLGYSWSDLFGEVRALTGVLGLSNEEYALALEATTALEEGTGELANAVDTFVNDEATQWNSVMQQVTTATMKLIDWIGGPEGLIRIIVTLGEIFVTYFAVSMVQSLMKFTSYVLKATSGVWGWVAAMVSAITANTVLQSVLTFGASLALTGAAIWGAYELAGYLTDKIFEDYNVADTGIGTTTSTNPQVEVTFNSQTTVDPISGTTTNSTSSNSQTSY